MRNRKAYGHRLMAASALGCSVLLASGCTWNGLNSLPLPGTVGTDSDSFDITAIVPDVGTLTRNSPVMIDDVTVGSIRDISADENWNARVTIGLQEGTKVPKGTTATVGQASLLGAQYLELQPPEGAAASGSGLLHDGDVIPLSRGGEFPSTEKTLSTLSLVLNGGGLAQLQDITKELNAALGGNESSLHDLLPRLDDLVTTLDDQRADIVAAMDGMNRLSETVNEQSDVLDTALTDLQPATKILADEKDALTDAILALGTFSSTADDVMTESGQDLRSMVKNLKPILGAVADAGKALPNTLTLLFTFPFPMDTLFNAMRGDYTNLWDEVDLTGERIDRSLFVGSPAVSPDEADSDWVKALSNAGTAAGDPFHPTIPDASAGGDVEQPGADVSMPGGGSPGGSAPGTGEAPEPPDGKVEAQFEQRDEELFGPAASGDGK